MCSVVSSPPEQAKLFPGEKYQQQLATVLLLGQLQRKMEMKEFFFFLLKIIFMDVAPARLSDINNNRGEICVYQQILFAYGRIYPGQQMAVIRSSRIRFDAVSC